MSRRRHIASVVLNFNSAADVAVLLPQLLLQTDVQHTLIVVDNASVASETRRLREVFVKSYPLGIVCSTEEICLYPGNHCDKANAYLVLNHENRGYSSGNNIGLRLAEKIGVDAVLIVNPDVRIENKSYLLRLSDALFAQEKNCIAASRIVGPDEKDQNPLREPGFWEEFLWPLVSLARRGGQSSSHVMPIPDDRSVFVPKVSGCCMMLRTSFIQAAGWLDEGVFLYCEEPILSTKVARYQGRIVFVPTLLAMHMHNEIEKDSASLRMLLFVESRKYYLKYYSSYGPVLRAALGASYFALKLLHRMKMVFFRV